MDCDPLLNTQTLSPDDFIGRKTLIIVIPAYQPTYALVDIVGQLSNDSERIIVVDDGSDKKYAQIFKDINEKAHVTVLKHAVNLGKGQSLKTAFNHILLNFLEVNYVITVDADGQHLHKDIVKIAKIVNGSGSDLYLGVRKFDGNIPLRSKIGNYLTRVIFFLSTGRDLQDTQTGLRGIHTSFLPDLLKIKASKYDFELEMLHLALRKKLTIHQVPIKTVYLENNQSSHFAPFLDSLRIYYVFLRYVSTSLVASVVDMAFFSTFYYFTEEVPLSLILGRLLTLSLYFLAAKYYVFKSEERFKPELLKFFMVASIYFAISYYAIIALVTNGTLNPYAAKMTVETALFFASFVAQRSFVFIFRE